MASSCCSVIFSRLDIPAYPSKSSHKSYTFSITFQTFHYTLPPLVIENSDILYLFVSHAQEYLYVVVGSIWLFLHDRVSFSWKEDIKVETRRQGEKERRRRGKKDARRQGGDVTHQSLRTPAWGEAQWPLQRHWLYTVRLRSEKSDTTVDWLQYHQTILTFTIR